MRRGNGPTPGSTSSTISIASFQNGTIVFSPVRLKSSSMKSSETSQKYSWPGREQNHVIQVSVDVGVDEAEPRSMMLLAKCPGGERGDRKMCEGRRCVGERRKRGRWCVKDEIKLGIGKRDSGRKTHCIPPPVLQPPPLIHRPLRWLAPTPDRPQDPHEEPRLATTAPISGPCWSDKRVGKQGRCQQLKDGPALSKLRSMNNLVGELVLHSDYRHLSLSILLKSTCRRLSCMPGPV